jgi:hypothetical protein
MLHEALRVAFASWLLLEIVVLHFGTGYLLLEPAAAVLVGGTSPQHKGTARFPVLQAAQNGCEVQLKGSLAHRAQWLLRLTRPCAALTGLQPPISSTRR